VSVLLDEDPAMVPPVAKMATLGNELIARQERGHVGSKLRNVDMEGDTGDDSPIGRTSVGDVQTNVGRQESSVPGVLPRLERESRGELSSGGSEESNEGSSEHGKEEQEAGGR